MLELAAVVEDPHTRLAAVMPAYHFHEVHAVRVQASPARILAVAVRSGFVDLGDEPGREVVVGTKLRLGSRRADLDRYANTAMNFLVQEEADGWCRLSTETRVFGTDDGARRRFAVYWRMIYPGSALIRRMWLQAIKRRAEA